MPDFTTKPISNLTLDNQTRQQLGMNQSGNLPNPQTGRKLKWWILSVICLALAVGTYLIMSKPKPMENKIALSFEAGQTLPSSGESGIRLVISNPGTKTIEDLNLDLIYPSGVVYISSLPAAENLSGTKFGLPNLSGGENLAVILKLKTQAASGDHKIIRANLRYKASGSSATLGAETAKDFLIENSGFDITAEGPQTVANGEPFQLKLHYTNNTQTNSLGLRIKLRAPTSFNLVQAAPEVTGGPNTWLVSRLDANQTGEIDLWGSFIGTALGETQNFTASLEVLNANGAYITQSNFDFPILIKQQPLSINQELADKRLETLKPGDLLEITIKYQNSSALAAKGVRITLEVDGKFIDWNKAKAVNGQISQGSITWTPGTLPDLAILPPSGTGNLKVSLPILDPPSRDSSTNLKAISQIKISSEEYSTPISGQPLELKLSTVPKIIPTLSYVEGANPPKVGQETVYMVRLQATNTTNKILKTKVTARLPLGNQSLLIDSLDDNVKLNSSKNTLEWQIEDMAPHAGAFTQPEETTFKIRTIPAGAQAGKALTLLTNIALSGIDEFTQKTIDAKASDLNSDGAGKNGSGKVLP